MNISIPITLKLWKCVKFFEPFDLFIRVEKVIICTRFDASGKRKVSYDKNVILSSLSFFKIVQFSSYIQRIFLLYFSYDQIISMFNKYNNLNIKFLWINSKSIQSFFVCKNWTRSKIFYILSSLYYYKNVFFFLSVSSIQLSNPYIRNG